MKRVSVAVICILLITTPSFAQKLYRRMPEIPFSMIIQNDRDIIGHRISFSDFIDYSDLSTSPFYESKNEKKFKQSLNAAKAVLLLDKISKVSGYIETKSGNYFVLENKYGKIYFKDDNVGYRDFIYDWSMCDSLKAWLNENCNYRDVRPYKGAEPKFIKIEWISIEPNMDESPGVSYNCEYKSSYISNEIVLTTKETMASNSLKDLEMTSLEGKLNALNKYLDEKEEQARIEAKKKRVADSLNAIRRVEESQRLTEELQKLEKEKAEMEAANIRKYGKTYGKLINEGRVRIGMTKEMCRAAWGIPDDINRMTSIYGGVQEQWVYKIGEFKSNYLYFDNGKLTTIQEF